MRLDTARRKDPMHLYYVLFLELNLNSLARGELRVIGRPLNLRLVFICIIIIFIRVNIEG